MFYKEEFAIYSTTELVAKKKRLKRTQIGLMILATVVGTTLALVMLIKKVHTGIEIVPIILVAGNMYPLLSFSTLRKSIQNEIDRRNIE